MQCRELIQKVEKGVKQMIYERGNVATCSGGICERCDIRYNRDCEWRKKICMKRGNA